MRSCLYDCRVRHDRYEPRRYGFLNRIFMFSLDLDEIDELCERIPILSRNQGNIYSFRDDDHIFMGHSSLRENVIAYLREQGETAPVGRIQLLTNLRTFGYVFNPVSFYTCYDTEGEPLCILVEVHNTFGELKPFLIRRDELSADVFASTRPKEFYISPFSALDKYLCLKLHIPTDHLALYVSSRHRPGDPKPFFSAALTGTRAPLSTANLLWFSARFPFVTLKVIFMIHWHALRLYRLGVPFHRKSENPELQTGIYAKARLR